MGNFAFPRQTDKAQESQVPCKAESPVSCLLSLRVAPAVAGDPVREQNGQKCAHPPTAALGGDAGSQAGAEMGAPTNVRPAPTSASAHNGDRRNADN